MTPQVRQLAQEYLNEIKSSPYLQNLFDRQAADIGSNWWIIGGNNTTTGNPMLASDPHLALDTPPIWYEAHLNVSNDPEFGPMNVNGVTLAGAPGIVLGCNDRICWGATVNPLDVTDVYLEELRNGPNGSPAFTVFEGQEEPITFIPQKYLVNRIGDGIADNLTRANVGPADGGVTLVVPRRNNGPIVRVLFGVLGLSVQYTGWRSTQEIDVFRQWARARNIDDFKRGLESFDFGSQNWSYADVDGNIAYFTTTEVPVREDLQAGNVEGVPPFLIRDGTHTAKNEWLPVQNRQPGQSLNYEILAADELPNVVNPPQGYISNANQDPVGTTLDNNPLNQLRRNGGIYYLNVGYDGGFRQGRIVRLIEESLAGDNKISLRRMQRIQANDQMLDAEILTPHISAAFENSADAPGELGALHNDQGVIDAVARLRRWDFSTPTGIREGYDPGDDPAALPEPSREEVRHSVAATIYSVWRSRILANTIDVTLAGLGLQNNLPGNDQALAVLRNMLETFPTKKGVGASGLNFFPAAAPTPEAARDTIILRSLKEALDLLASNTFAAAFGRSTNQEDYRWGRLHRIVFDHPLRGPFDIPSAGGFSNVSDRLPGVARSGGYQVVNASSHSARASSVNGFMFGSGSSRRIVSDMAASGVNAYQIIPGGQSGVLGSPFYANQLGRWLTHQYHQILLSPGQVQGDTASELVYTP
jgi:penicillin amidase